MILFRHSIQTTWRVLSLSLLAAAVAQSAMAQQTSREPLPMNWTAEQDHQNMMDQLGIKTVRPGPSGNEKAPNHANYDESTANPFPVLPDVLKLKNGTKVTSPAIWWKRQRRWCACTATGATAATGGTRGSNT